MQKAGFTCSLWMPCPITLVASAGRTAKPIEDSLRVSLMGSEMILGIAEDHWRRGASEIGVSKAMELPG